MKTKNGFLTQSDISYMYLLAEKLKEISREEDLLQIDSEFYKALKEDLLCKDEEYIYDNTHKCKHA